MENENYLNGMEKSSNISENKPTKTLIQCNECQYVCNSEREQVAHKNSQHPRNTLHQCSKCEFRTPVRSNLKKHTEVEHTGVQYRCVKV